MISEPRGTSQRSAREGLANALVQVQVLVDGRGLEGPGHRRSGAVDHDLQGDPALGGVLVRVDKIRRYSGFEVLQER